MENNKPEMWVEGEHDEFIDDYSYHKETGGCRGMLISFAAIILALAVWGIYEFFN